MSISPVGLDTSAAIIRPFDATPLFSLLVQIEKHPKKSWIYIFLDPLSGWRKSKAMFRTHLSDSTHSLPRYFDDGRFQDFGGKQLCFVPFLFITQVLGFYICSKIS
jgi:hypothetical protein